MITLELVAGGSALLAAGATVVGAAFLLLFFQRGNPWGILNDIASVVLMVATIPVALVVARLEDEPPIATFAWGIALIGIAGMVAAAGFQTALVARIRTYEQLLGRTLGSGAIVRLWYLLAGLLGFRSLGQPLAVLAVASGVGVIAVGYGFAVGGQRHPLSAIGGTVLFVASTAFLVILGVQLLSGDLVVPHWTA